MLKRTLLWTILTLVMASAAPADRMVAEFRLRKDPNAPMRGWILNYDDAGFRFERFGGGSRLSIRWEDLVEADAHALRTRFGLEQTEDERLGLIPGHVISFKGGGEVRGLLERVDEDGRHWVRTKGLLLPYPKERIEKVTETKVKEEEVYSADEVYARRLERRPPRTAKEHHRLADYLYDIGSWEGALKQYTEATDQDPSLRAEVEGRVAELRDYMQDKAAAVVFQKAKKLGNLDGRYNDAIGLIEQYTANHPGASRRGERLVEELRAKQLERKQARFDAVKNEEFDRSVRRYLARTQPDLETAKAWATTQLKEVLKRRVTSRLELSKDEWDLFSAHHGKGAPHFATYWGGSFIVNRRVPKGKSSKRTVRGDPDAWWAHYGDVNTRSNWLRAYAVERLPELFEVVYVRNAPCPRCGGTGYVRKMSLTPFGKGQHEWREVCPRCFGAKEDRAIAYR